MTSLIMSEAYAAHFIKVDVFVSSTMVLWLVIIDEHRAYFINFDEKTCQFWRHPNSIKSEKDKINTPSRIYSINKYI